MLVFNRPKRGQNGGKMENLKIKFFKNNRIVGGEGGIRTYYKVLHRRVYARATQILVWPLSIDLFSAALKWGQNGGSSRLSLLAVLSISRISHCRPRGPTLRGFVLSGASFLQQFCANTIRLTKLPSKFRAIPILFLLILIGGCSNSCDTSSLHAPSPSSVNASKVDCKPQKVEPLTLSADFDEQYELQEKPGARYGKNHLSCFRSIDDEGSAIIDSCESITTEIESDAE